MYNVIIMCAGNLEMVIREEFNVPLTVKCRVWHRYLKHTYELLSKADQSLHEAGLYNGQVSIYKCSTACSACSATSHAIYRHNRPCPCTCPRYTAKASL